MHTLTAPGEQRGESSRVRDPWVSNSQVASYSLFLPPRLLLLHCTPALAPACFRTGAFTCLPNLMTAKTIPDTHPMQCSTCGKRQEGKINANKVPLGSRPPAWKQGVPSSFVSFHLLIFWGKSWQRRSVSLWVGWIAGRGAAKNGSNVIQGRRKAAATIAAWSFKKCRIESEMTRYLIWHMMKNFEAFGWRWKLQRRMAAMWSGGRQKANSIIFLKMRNWVEDDELLDLTHYKKLLNNVKKMSVSQFRAMQLSCSLVSCFNVELNDEELLRNLIRGASKIHFNTMQLSCSLIFFQKVWNWVEVDEILDLTHDEDLLNNVIKGGVEKQLQYDATFRLLLVVPMLPKYCLLVSWAHPLLLKNQMWNSLLYDAWTHFQQAES